MRGGERVLLVEIVRRGSSVGVTGWSGEWG